MIRDQFIAELDAWLCETAPTSKHYERLLSLFDEVLAFVPEAYKAETEEWDQYDYPHGAGEG